jgi:arsenate reductase (thioredoxin)
MQQNPINVLFLCTHNSARSILAEATLNHLGQGRFKAWSAGSSPREHQQPNPMALEALQNAAISTDGLRSKNWDEFAAPEVANVRRAGPPQASTAPSGGSEVHEVTSVGVIFDLIITVCDNAAGEVCPFWPGHPATAHWSYPDPSEAPGGEAEKREAFRQTLLAIHRRLELFVNLPPEALERLALQTSARGLVGT